MIISEQKFKKKSLFRYRTFYIYMKVSSKILREGWKIGTVKRLLEIGFSIV